MRPISTAAFPMQSTDKTCLIESNSKKAGLMSRSKSGFAVAKSGFLSSLAAFNTFDLPESGLKLSG